MSGFRNALETRSIVSQTLWGSMIIRFCRVSTLALLRRVKLGEDSRQSKAIHLSRFVGFTLDLHLRSQDPTYIMAFTMSELLCLNLRLERAHKS